MSRQLAIAAVTAVPPTVAAVLTFIQSRAARRQASRETAAALTGAVDTIATGLERVESAIGRVQDSVVGLRERVATLEGAAMVRRRPSA